MTNLDSNDKSSWTPKSSNWAALGINQLKWQIDKGAKLENVLINKKKVQFANHTIKWTI